MALKKLMIGMIVIANLASAETDGIKEMKEVLGIDRIKQDVADRMQSECQTVVSMVRYLCNKLSPEEAEKLAKHFERSAEEYKIPQNASDNAPLWYFYVEKTLNTVVSKYDKADANQVVDKELNPTINGLHRSNQDGRACIEQMVELLKRRAKGESIETYRDWHRVYTTFKTEGEGSSKLYVLTKHEDEFINGVRQERVLSQGLNANQLMLLKKWYDGLNLYDAANGESSLSEEVEGLIKNVSKICPVPVVLEQFEKKLKS